MKKRTLSTILCLGLVMGMLQGCGNSTETKNEPTAEQTETTEAEEESVPAQETDAGEEDAGQGEEAVASGSFLDEIEPDATLTYWEMQWASGEYQNHVQAMVDQFNTENEYGITVNLEMIPWDGYYETFLTAVTSGTAPDVYTGASTAPTQYAEMGESLALDPIIDAWKAENNPILDDIAEQYWGFFKYDGVTYGLPYGVDPKQITYRKDFFEEAGIDTLPTTYDEFLEVCAKLKEKFPDKIPCLLTAGGNDPSSNHMAEVLNGLNAAGMFDTNKNATMMTDAQRENYEFVKTMMDEGYMSEGSGGYGDADVEKIWLSGGACILFGRSGNIMLNTDIEENVSVLPPFAGPSASEGKYCANVNGVAGFSQTEYPNAARYFLKWWMENNIQILAGTGNGNLPLRESYYTHEAYKEHAWYQETMDNCIKTGITQAYPLDSMFPEFATMEGEKVLAVALAEVIEGTDVETALQDSNDAIQTVFDDAREAAE